MVWGGFSFVIVVCAVWGCECGCSGLSVKLGDFRLLEG